MLTAFVSFLYILEDLQREIPPQNGGFLFFSKEDVKPKLIGNNKGRTPLLYSMST